MKSKTCSNNLQQIRQERKKNEKQKDEGKTNKNVSGQSPSILIITLNENDANT